MTSWNCRAVFALALLAAAAPVRAQQDFPNRPMTMVVPFTPGGSTDVTSYVQNSCAAVADMSSLYDCA